MPIIIRPPRRTLGSAAAAARGPNELRGARIAAAVSGSGSARTHISPPIDSGGPGPVRRSVRRRPPEAGDEPTRPPDVLLVVPAEPFPQQLLLRGRLNEYPQEGYRPEEPQADVQRGNAAPE